VTITMSRSDADLNTNATIVTHLINQTDTTHDKNHCHLPLTVLQSQAISGARAPTSLQRNPHHQQFQNTINTPQSSTKANTNKSILPHNTKSTQKNNVQLTLNNNNTNNPVGDLMQPNKPLNSIRIYFQNINGINKNNWSDWEESARQIRKFNVDIFGCAETNLAWTEAKRKLAQNIMKKEVKQANLSVANSNEVGTTEYQPGDVATCVVGKYNGRIIEQIIDPTGLGRWAGHILIANQHQ
jgi:hypothetical protein